MQFGSDPKILQKKNILAVKTYRSLEDMLADDSVELVIVNTPNSTHYEYAKKALQAGKHVIVEKPFTVTVDEGKELIALAEKQNKKLSVYQNRRYDSDFKILKKVVRKNGWAKSLRLKCISTGLKMSLVPKVHKEIPGPGNGILYDLGSHLIDQALQLFGMPRKIFADIQILRPISQVDDYFELLLYYENYRVRLKASLAVREALPGYILHGLKGSFIKQRTDVQETLLQAGIAPGKSDWGTEPPSEMGLLHTEKNGEIIREFVQSEQGNYGEYYDGIYQAIRNNKPLPVTAEDGLKVIKIIEAAYKSNNAKCVVDL